MRISLPWRTVTGNAPKALQTPTSPGSCQPSFSAALVDIGPAIPTLAAIATVFAYVGGPTQFARDLQMAPLASGAGIAVVLGLIIALVYSRVYTAADRAYPGSFAALRQRVDKLGARLQVLERLRPSSVSVAEAMAHAEAVSHYQALERGLVQGGPQWVNGSGYVDLLTRLHRAEEAMITIEPIEDVIAGAYYDEQRIHGSTIRDNLDLLKRLRAAVQALSPSGSVYLKQLPRTETLPDGTRDPARNPVAAALTANPAAGVTGMATMFVPPFPPDAGPAPNGVNQEAAAAPPSDRISAPTTNEAPSARADEPPAPAQPIIEGPSATVNNGVMVQMVADSSATVDHTLSLAARKLVEAEARVALRQVRHAINDFRDASRLGLVQSRSRILATMSLTGIITYVLLAFAVNLNAPPDRTAGDPIAAAGAVYLIGAVVGLFNRLYQESGDASAIEDYGLSRTRTLLTPMLSGLAAVGGVLLTGMLSGMIDLNLITPAGIGNGPAVPMSRQLTTMSTIFSLQSYPFAIVLAAAFGFTPRLFLERLQSVSDQTRQNLQSTEANRSVAPAPADPASGGAG
jgi:hypothetical protein